MAHAPADRLCTDTTDVAIDGDTRLRQLGYTPRLERGLTTPAPSSSRSPTSPPRAPY